MNYETVDGQTAIEVVLSDGTVWLTIGKMADLFRRNKSAIFKAYKLAKNQTDAIERDGIAAVGDVVEKGRSKHRRGDNTYAIKYKFEYQGEDYFGFQDFA